jgi:selenocysteine lyase/cysteine desulfurase
MAAPPDPTRFRAQFPVLERLGYLNAGTEGPLPQAAADAVRERVDGELSGGRSGPRYMNRVKELATELRAAYAGVLGCRSDELALTGSTTDGVNTVLAALDLRPGDEVLTSDEEHPGLLAPLALARRRRGITIRVVPFTELAGAVSAATRLVACSHVSWVGGLVVDHAGLAASGVPVLLDGAQGIGAVPADVAELGCDFYAASGQKWLCGPESSGCLFVRPERFDEMDIAWPGYGSLADPHEPLDSPPAEGAARFDHGFPPGIRSAWALAALGVLEQAGWAWVYGRSSELAARLAARLREAGLTVSPRGPSTLVSWATADPEAEVKRLAAERIVVRSIPASGLVRASVGAWSSEDELDRLVVLVSA